MSQYFSRLVNLTLGGLISGITLSGFSVAAQSEPTTKNVGAPNSYLGIGGALGLGGNTTALGAGGLAILSKVKSTNNLSLHDATVIFGNGAATTMIILTADFPIHGNSGETIISPFIGGGTMLRYDRGLYLSPAISGGIDIPLSKDFTGTLRLNAGFPSNRNADIGILVGAGYSFGSRSN
jgi:hypothetical protein